MLTVLSMQQELLNKTEHTIIWNTDFYNHHVDKAEIVIKSITIIDAYIFILFKRT